MIAHHVLFWLKPETTTAQQSDFRAGLESLSAIPSITHLHIGTPADISRSVVDTTYTFSMIAFFENMEGHDIYQVHTVHQTFLNNFRELFEKVIIYDAD
ncbi:Dabb family protein [Pedobacter antarcticus]|uniref:Dabb family protein n=1 Tax=Pedobacter antarcticus TaxID=34086 RepID=UPI001C575E47|nr:Dabb family protein [Pedobacter antarcticus]